MLVITTLAGSGTTFAEIFPEFCAVKLRVARLPVRLTSEIEIEPERPGVIPEMPSWARIAAPRVVKVTLSDRKLPEVFPPLEEAVRTPFVTFPITWLPNENEPENPVWVVPAAVVVMAAVLVKTKFSGRIRAGLGVIPPTLVAMTLMFSNGGPSGPVANVVVPPEVWT